jgi:hypothetical protein
LLGWSVIAKIVIRAHGQRLSKPENLSTSSCLSNKWAAKDAEVTLVWNAERLLLGAFEPDR